MFLFRILSLGVLGYVGYRNRFRIQRFLESQGIQTPFMRRNLGEFVQSGVAKLTGKAENLTHRTSDPIDEETRRAG